LLAGAHMADDQKDALEGMMAYHKRSTVAHCVGGQRCNPEP